MVGGVVLFSWRGGVGCHVRYQDCVGVDTQEVGGNRPWAALQDLHRKWQETRSIVVKAPHIYVRVRVFECWERNNSKCSVFIFKATCPILTGDADPIHTLVWENSLTFEATGHLVVCQPQQRWGTQYTEVEPLTGSQGPPWLHLRSLSAAETSRGNKAEVEKLCGFTVKIEMGPLLPGREHTCRG